MKITVFGAGAVGGYLAAKLTGAGLGVRVVSRGAQLDAIRARGLLLIEGGLERAIRVEASDNAASLGHQDLVILALKAHSLLPAAPEIAALLGKETVLVPAQNGVPWWYFHREGGSLDGERIAAIDPGGALYRSLDPARVIGCVVHIAASVPKPGVIRHQSGNRLILGEPDGTASQRLLRIGALLASAGLVIGTTPTIRREIWHKLWGNIAFNPVSAVTQADMGRLLADPGARRVIVAIMTEAEAVANRLGIRFDMDVQTRIEGLKRLGAYKTSMLQDVEAGRPIELDALVGAVIEIAARFGIPTPMMEIVAMLARLRATPPR